MLPKKERPAALARGKALDAQAAKLKPSDSHSPHASQTVVLEIGLHDRGRLVDRHGYLHSEARRIHRVGEGGVLTAYPWQDDSIKGYALRARFLIVRALKRRAAQ